MLLRNNHNKIAKIGTLTLIYYYHLIFRRQSNIANCPNNYVLYKPKTHQKYSLYIVAFSLSSPFLWNSPSVFFLPFVLLPPGLRAHAFVEGSSAGVYPMAILWLGLGFASLAGTSQKWLCALLCIAYQEAHASLSHCKSWCHLGPLDSRVSALFLHYKITLLPFVINTLSCGEIP